MLHNVFNTSIYTIACITANYKQTDTVYWKLACSTAVRFGKLQNIHRHHNQWLNEGKGKEGKVSDILQTKILHVTSLKKSEI